MSRLADSNWCKSPNKIAVALAAREAMREYRAAKKLPVAFTWPRRLAESNWCKSLCTCGFPKRDCAYIAGELAKRLPDCPLGITSFGPERTNVTKTALAEPDQGAGHSAQSGQTASAPGSASAVRLADPNWCKRVLRLCQMCGITPKGTTSERACTSPSGVVHLRDWSGVTFCGKRPQDTWTLGPADPNWCKRL